MVQPEGLRGLSISIVGCGWLGMPLGEHLINQEAKVFGTVRRKEELEKLKLLGAHPFQYNSELEDEIPSSVANSDYVIITLPPNKSKSELTFLNSLKQIASQLNRSAKVIFISSISVYPKTGSFDEESTDLNEDSTSLKAERMLIDELGNRLVRLRLGGLIGGGRHPMKNLSGKEMNSSGSENLHLVHREDVIQFIVELIKSNFSTRIFNVVYPSQISKKNYYIKMAELNNLEAPIYNTSEKNTRLIKSNNISILQDFSFQFDPLDFRFETLG